MKIVLVMQLSTVFLFAALSAGAATNAQSTVSFTGKNVPLEQVFAAVKKQTGYTFVYYAEALKAAHKVTLDVKGLTMEEFLEVCLRDEPLTYKIIGQTVMIAGKEVQKAELEPAQGEPSTSMISGKITNDKGEPLAGASVVVKGTKKGTITGADGSFSLKGINPENILIVSYAGFTTREFHIEKNSNFILELQQSTNPLDEAQVIAYGSTTERLGTGDVTTIKGDDIQRQPVGNPLLALEGSVPGMFITQSSGVPGSGVTVQIRGQGSIGSGNDPFYVIDGVPYTDQLLPNLGNVLGLSYANPVSGAANSGNPLSYINPSDIESISILKDADATAIYGSRAANGAILITTKKGKAGETKVDINVQDGWGQVTRKLDLMSDQQYLEMRHEGIQNDGLTIGTTDYDLNGTWDTTRYTDWQKRLIGGTAQYTNISGSFSGGSLTTQYLVSGTYHRETSVFPGNFSDQKGSMHFNLNSASSNQRFHLQLTGSYQADNNILPQADLTGTAITLAPVAPSLYAPDGTLNWAPDSSGTSTWANPLAALYNTYSNKANNLVANSVLSYTIIPGLIVKSNFGYTNLQTNEIVGLPLEAIAPEYRPISTSMAQYGNNNIHSWIVEPQAEYKQIVGNGKIDFLVGSTIQQNNSNGQQLGAYGFNSDLLLNSIAAASGTYVISTTAAIYKYSAIFARLGYDFSDKYLINLTGRRDGSSRFGSMNQFHDFESAGLGWIFSKENFFQRNFPVLSFGKFRGSYGVTGSDQIGDYAFLNLYSPISVPNPYQGVVSLTSTGLTNPYLQWEATKKLEFGLDLGFFKDRITINGDYFRNRTSNELLGYPLPVITGFTVIVKNLPATVQNKGWEFALKTINVKGKDFSWITQFNITIPSNKLISYPGLATSTYASTLEVGKPITSVRLFHLLGVNDTTGEYEFSSVKGMPTYTPVYGTDNNTVMNTTPAFYGGMQNIFAYKKFQLAVLLQFTKQRAPNYFFGAYIPGAFQGGLGNQPTYVLKRWQNPGDVRPIERYNSDFNLETQYGDAVSSDGGRTDASYIRFKNVALSWELPHRWEKGAHVQNASLFVQGQNLFTITKYEGMDPENQSLTSIPVLRVLTIGAHLTL